MADKQLKLKVVCTELPVVVTLKLTDDRGGPLCATPRASHITWQKET